jgi:hypothetical protein
MNYRAEYNKILKELKEDMKLGPVEILSGPCRGIIVNDKASFMEYAKRLDEWMFPTTPTPFIAH